MRRLVFTPPGPSGSQGGPRCVRMPHMSRRSLEDIAATISIVDPKLDYYAITLTLDENGRSVIDTQTEWHGWADAERGTEIRVPSLVKPEWMIRNWEGLEQPYVVVKDESEWFVFFQIGGNALVRKEIAATFLADTFRAMYSEPAIRRTDYGSSFVGLTLLPKAATQHAPTPKLRMAVFSRDNRRCRICGSSPADNEHVQLHIHHIRPWEKGGHTNIENLITLCHTCHVGLDPHEDHSLFDLLAPLKDGQDHTAGVNRYRVRLREELAQTDGSGSTSSLSGGQPRKKR
jgi:hypothetical protein